jgi:tripartite ATP-independent transporter DctM subunit
MSAEFSVLLLVGLLLVGIFSGIPLAWVIGFVGIAVPLVVWGPSFWAVAVTQAYDMVNNWVLIAVPLFVLMSLLLDKSGIMADMYRAVYQWSGPLRGGLAVATVIACTIFAACVGVAAGGVVTMTIVALPHMLKYGYDRKIAIGSILSGGTLGQLIPPSILMVLYGVVCQVSVGQMFAAGFTAGIWLSLIYISYILVRSYFQKGLCPALPVEDRIGFLEKVRGSTSLILPALVVIVVLGSIFSGAASPTEASAVGVVGALCCCVVNRQLNWKNVKNSLMETLNLSGMIGWLLLASVCLASAFVAAGGGDLVEDLLVAIPGGRWPALIVVLAFLVILGMFMEPTGIVLVAGPLFAPVIVKMGFDALWFAMLFMITLQTAYISPPFGWSLFYLTGAAKPPVKLSEAYSASWIFVGLQVLGLLIFILWPDSILWPAHLLFK